MAIYEWLWKPSNDNILNIPSNMVIHYSPFLVFERAFDY
jgi:hypothetical protein